MARGFALVELGGAQQETSQKKFARLYALLRDPSLAGGWPEAAAVMNVFSVRRVTPGDTNFNTFVEIDAATEQALQQAFTAIENSFSHVEGYEL